MAKISYKDKMKCRKLSDFEKEEKND